MFFKKAAAGRKNPETEIQNAVRNELRKDGWMVIRHQQGLGAYKGFADLTAVKDGKLYTLKLKRRQGD